MGICRQPGIKWLVERKNRLESKRVDGREGDRPMSEKLFEITTDNLDTGLRGYPIGYCNTSTVDPVKGLFYIGHPVEKLAEKDPEEVIFLLYYGKEASAQELAAFKKELTSRME